MKWTRSTVISGYWYAHGSQGQNFEITRKKRDSKLPYLAVEWRVWSKAEWTDSFSTLEEAQKACERRNR
jgi:hypothetical protein